MRLGVNIDHVATIREARKTNEPEPIYAALLVQEALADGITMHLREDRRHIQDRDVYQVREIVKIPLNLEMSLNEEIVRIALDVKPHQATLVPENRQEITTEGGLDVVANSDRVSEVIKRLKGEGILVSLFIDPQEWQIEQAKNLGADAIELHTGNYANAKHDMEKRLELEKLIDAAKYAKSLGLHVHAGHGLTYENVKPVAAIKEIEELNIGHSIIAKSVFVGMKEAVSLMRQLIHEARWKLA
ncbi:pyridoxine 5'-phosphate synthase [Hippea maritima]|uniref:Pyridoxine 5'-phosphate synthase n=1 Tax=Hippea maritima (strain ATCC 700847 / DSM 10411 / MH2) TaxID=760142 RepID=F2LUV0_HIPMA|nr:pyridoxine 5'-phosphate synthase [Hippea maritima]AEA33555.1 Pyridoxine 5'-phosphate synthase [Hippea maritima DSM 10411]